MALLGLIGYPLSHSFSPAYFASLFERENRHDLSYELFPLADISLLPGWLRSAEGLKGFNVTIPYKIAIIPYLDKLDESAAETGAVNTVTVELVDGEFFLTGYNTDVYGFIESIKPLLQDHHKRALILGTGGAARAVAKGFDCLGLEYSFVSRKRTDSDLTWEDLDKAVVEKYDVIVNATPVGMSSTGGQLPFPVSCLDKRHLVFDLVYNPEKTSFLEAAEIRGAEIKNGLEMLHLQAEKAWKIFSIFC